MIIVDASAVVEVLRRTEAGERIQRLLEPPEETLHAPHHVDLEVASALRRLAIHSTMSQRAAGRALLAIATMDIQRYPHTELLPRIWALRHNVTAYDAAYLALAEVLRAPLVTCDAALATIPGSRAEVVCI